VVRKHKTSMDAIERETAEAVSQTRPSKADLCSTLALISEFKPDCRWQRKIVEEKLGKKIPLKIKFKQVNFIGTTGCCVVDSNGKICLVEGSGSQHVCRELLKYSSCMVGSTVYLSRFPCIQCIRTLITLKPSKVIAVKTSMLFSDMPWLCSWFENFNEPENDMIQAISKFENSSLTELKKKTLVELEMRKIESLVAKSGLALSIYSPRSDSLSWKIFKKVPVIHPTSIQWSMMCAVLSCTRSEYYVYKGEKDRHETPVGAVLISLPSNDVGSLDSFKVQQNNKSTLIPKFVAAGVGYNGHLPGLTLDDILQLQTSFHAEENVINTASSYGLLGATSVLFCTLAPCNDCSRFIDSTNCLSCNLTLPDSAKIKRKPSATSMEVTNVVSPEVLNTVNSGVPTIQPIVQYVASNDLSPASSEVSNTMPSEESNRITTSAPNLVSGALTHVASSEVIANPSHFSEDIKDTFLFKSLKLLCKTEDLSGHCKGAKDCLDFVIQFRETARNFTVLCGETILNRRKKLIVKVLGGNLEYLQKSPKIFDYMDLINQGFIYEDLILLSHLYSLYPDLIIDVLVKKLMIYNQHNQVSKNCLDVFMVFKHYLNLDILKICEQLKIEKFQQPAVYAILGHRQQLLSLDIYSQSDFNLNIKGFCERFKNMKAEALDEDSSAVEDPINVGKELYEYLCLFRTGDLPFFRTWVINVYRSHKLPVDYSTFSQLLEKTISDPSKLPQQRCENGRTYCDLCSDYILPFDYFFKFDDLQLCFTCVQIKM
jgi:deoxycytidylate deaminase